MTLDASEIAGLLPYLTPEERAEMDTHLVSVRPREGLLDFVPRMNPRYKAPHHLEPLVEQLERSWVEPVRVTACAPPRHAKTETVLMFIALTLLLYPAKTIGYVTYEAHVAESKSRKGRQLARDAGVQLAMDANRLGEWRTPQGGGVLATGIGGPLTSHGIDILLVDDPYKNRVDAESAAYRRMATDWWNDVAETRIEPGGSAFVFHTRWHTDDLIAHVHSTDTEESKQWKHVWLPAISNAGLALWPERWPLAALLKKRTAVGEYTWASLYQGLPRPRGSKVFGDLHYYDELPKRGYREAFGLDLAYTAKTQSDWSILVRLFECQGYWYVVDVVRCQVAAPEFAAKLKIIQQPNPDATMRWYASGTEIGSADFIRRLGVNLHARNATGDKFQRAQPVAAAWNAGRVLLPRNAPWLAAFVEVISTFTGVNDAVDDDVDALSAAFDSLNPPVIDEVRPRPGTLEHARAEHERMMESARQQAEREYRRETDPLSVEWNNG